MNIVAIIPARGGSKSIPKKNIKLLNGKPLLVYSIEAAIGTPSINRVIVSTDDSEISSLALKHGAEVVLRPIQLSGDEASSESALLHTLDYLREGEGYEPDLVVFLQATSPIREDDDIQLAIDAIIEANADSLFSACRVEGFVWRQFSEQIVPINYDPIARPRRQDLKESVLEENGSIYIFKPHILRKYNSRLGGKISIYPMSPLSSFQIDLPEDLATMEKLIHIQASKSEEISPDRIELLVMDFDGVLTDNRAMVDQDGKEAVWVNRSDGWGIARLHDAGIPMIVISTESNPVVGARCNKLKIPYIHGCEDKLVALKRIVKEKKLNAGKIAYVGNDVNDLACMRWVGLPIAVADSVPEVIDIAKKITQSPGGYGAVREVADWLLKNENSK